MLFVTSDLGHLSIPISHGQKVVMTWQRDKRFLDLALDREGVALR